MMRKVVSIAVIAIILTQGNCRLKKNTLDKLWFYTYSSNTNKNDDIVVTPASFLYLHPDGSYARDFGKFDFGQWKERNSTLLLTSETGQVIAFPIKRFFGNELQLVSGKETVINSRVSAAYFLRPPIIHSRSKITNGEYPRQKKRMIRN